MTEITASTLLADMKPAWRAALGNRVSHEYVAGFVRRNRIRLEAALAPIAAAMNVKVHVAEPVPQGEARDKARSTRLRSAATNLAHRRVQAAADSIAKLRYQDVERVLRETPAEERRQVAYILGDLRADLSSEIDEVMREVLGEPANWSEYGRQEIYEPGSRAKREAMLAEDAAERFQRGDFNALGGVPLPPTKAHPPRQPTAEDKADLARALEAAAPMIAEEEREIEAAKSRERPVIMASLEAGGIVLLSLHTHLGKGSDLFQTYRDDTSRLHYVSYPKKGNRGTPSAVARAVLALERDGFEVRAEDPEVVKSLIVTGGLDHALPVGPPPPRAAREASARPPTRTADPDLIARVNALAADPPTSTIKYLVKTLRERGDLPLQVKDWKEGGWRPVEDAIEEREAKEARKLARKPKAERLRAGGEERPAKDANEEHAAQALVQLANMDPDKARQVNDAGFSKSDVATGHALARRWEATGELTGDEWEWAVAVANKYRRQVGPLPESPTAKGSRALAQRIANAEEAFVGIIEERGFTREQAVKAMETMLRTKVAVLDAVNGRINVKHGGFLEPGSIQNAVDAWTDTKAQPKPSKRTAPSLSYAGHSLATVQDIAAFLKRLLGKLYERYMLNINVVRNIGDHSVMLTFYRVPPDASELEAANAKCKVRINIHGAGRTNGSTWPDDATPAELTAYTVWAHNAPKFRKRTGPPSVVVAAVSSWFVLNIADLTGTSTPPPGGRLREEAEWAAAVLHGTKAEIANGLEPEQARRTAIANLGPDIDYYAKRDEEKWGYRP